MKPMYLIAAGLAATTAALAASSAGAATVFNFSTGNADGKLGALSQPATRDHPQTETADDFVLSSKTRLTGATFTGLLQGGAKVTDIKDVEIEFYKKFPGDSATRVAGVVTRNNSPGDHEIASATRDANDGSLSFRTQSLAEQFEVKNSVTTVRGGDAANEFTGGDGPIAGQEVTIDVNFDKAVTLDAGQLFFRPEVELADGSFFWLSAPKPILAPGTPFPPGSADLQAWIRNDALAPDWVRIGTDVTHQGPFNMAFSLTGVAGVPEPTSWALMIGGFGLMGATLRRNRRVAATASM